MTIFFKNAINKSETHQTGTSSCGVRADGTLACWGRGGAVEAPPAGKFLAVSAGGDHACGLTVRPAKLHATQIGKATDSVFLGPLH